MNVKSEYWRETIRCANELQTKKNVKGANLTKDFMLHIVKEVMNGNVNALGTGHYITNGKKNKVVITLASELQPLEKDRSFRNEVSFIKNIIKQPSRALIRFKDVGEDYTVDGLRKLGSSLKFSAEELREQRAKKDYKFKT